MPLTCVHILLHCVITWVAMISLDVYLVKQNHGDKKTGVLVMLVVEEFCHVVALRYISLWVASQIKSTKRGFAIVAWFVFIVIYDIKMYFIVENLWKKCSFFSLKATSFDSVSTGDIIKSYQHTKDSIPSQISSEEDETDKTEDCINNNVMKKYLTLCQALLLPALYLLFIGVDYVKNSVDAILFTEIQLQALWSTADIFDLVHLQTSIWEEETGQFSFAVAAFVYFYCYIGLILLPSLGLAELINSEKESNNISATKVHRISRIILLYVGTSVIRVYLLFVHHFSLTSSIFLGKNLLCTAIEVKNAVQTCFKMQTAPNSNTTVSVSRDKTAASLPPNPLTDGNAVFVRGSTPHTDCSVAQSNQESESSSRSQNDFNSKHKVASENPTLFSRDEVINVRERYQKKSQNDSGPIEGDIKRDDAINNLAGENSNRPDNEDHDFWLSQERDKSSRIPENDHSKNLLKRITSHKLNEQTHDKHYASFSMNPPSSILSSPSSSNSSVFVDKPVEQQSLENLCNILNRESTLIIPPPSNFASTVTLNSHNEERENKMNEVAKSDPFSISVKTEDLLVFENEKECT